MENTSFASAFSQKATAAPFTREALVNALRTSIEREDRPHILPVSSAVYNFAREIFSNFSSKLREMFPFSVPERDAEERRTHLLANGWYTAWGYWYRNGTDKGKRLSAAYMAQIEREESAFYRAKREEIEKNDPELYEKLLEPVNAPLLSTAHPMSKYKE